MQRKLRYTSHMLLFIWTGCEHANNSWFFQVWSQISGGTVGGMHPQQALLKLLLHNPHFALLSIMIVLSLTTLYLYQGAIAAVCPIWPSTRWYRWRHVLPHNQPNKFPSHSVKSLITFYSPPENPLDLSLSESVERDIQGLLSQAPIAFYVHPKC